MDSPWPGENSKLTALAVSDLKFFFGSFFFQEKGVAVKWTLRGRERIQN